MKKLLYLLVVVSMLISLSPVVWAQDSGNGDAGQTQDTGNPAPTDTPVPPTDTPAPAQAPVPTDTSVPPADTPTEVVPPADTPTEVVPPADTPTEVVPPAETPTEVVPPAETPTEVVPPAETPTEVVPPAETPTEVVPPAETPTEVVEPTATEVVTATVEPTATEVVTPTATPVGISHIAIRDAEGGLGNQVVTVTITTADVLILYAAAYDADGNFLQDVPVDWSTTGTLDAADPALATGAVSFAFTPVTAGTQGTIKADDGQGHAAEVSVEVAAPAPVETPISHITIRDAADGLGEQVMTRTITLSDTLVLYAAAYDADGNYLKDVPVDWTTTDTLDVVTATASASFSFTPLTVDTSGTIKADDGNGLVHETGPISVVAPEPAMAPISHIAIRTASDGFGEEVVTHTMFVSDTFILYAAAYDVDGNYLKDVAVDWASTGTLEPISVTAAISMTFVPQQVGSGTIVADDGNGNSYETGTIEVTTLANMAAAMRAALTGTWNTQRIAVQNTGGVDNSGTIDFYDENGNLQTGASISVGTLGTEANIGYGLPDALTTGQRYSAVGSFLDQASIVVHNTNLGARVGDAYLGFNANSIGSSLFFPLADHNWSGGNFSIITVQNAGSGDQDIQLFYYPMGSGTPVFTKTVTGLAQNAAVTFDFTQAEYNAIPDLNPPTPGSMGYVKVVGSDNLAGVLDRVRVRAAVVEQLDQMEPAQLPPASGTSRDLIWPMVFTRYSGNWTSGIHVLNTTGTSTHVTGHFADARNSFTQDLGMDLGPYEVGTWYLPTEITEASFLGSCTIHSSDADVLGFASTVKYGTAWSIGYGSGGLNKNFATPLNAYPLVYRLAVPGDNNANLVSGIQVVNAGGTAQFVTVHFVKSQDCTVTGWDTFDWVSDIAVAPNGSANYYLPQYPNGTIPQGWTGAATATANGNNVMGISSATHYAAGYGLEYNGDSVSTP